MQVGGPVYGVHLGGRSVTAARCTPVGEPVSTATPLPDAALPVSIDRVGDPVPVRTARGPLPAEQLLAAHLGDVLPEPRPAAVALAVPAEWRGHRRSVLGDALDDAGLPGVTIVGSPVAVAAQLTADGAVSDPALVAVVEVGELATSATVVRVRAGTVQEVAPAPAALAWGLVDAEDAVLALVLSRLPGPVPVEHGPALRSACRAAVQTLCDSPDATVQTPDQPVRVLRTEWEDELAAGAAGVVGHLRRALELAGTPVGDVTAVVLAGAGARLPVVAATVADELDVVPQVPADPATVAARGAAVLARAVADRIEADRGPSGGGPGGVGGADPSAADPAGAGVGRTLERRRHRARPTRQGSARVPAGRRLAVIVLLAVSLVLGGTSLVAALNADATAHAGLPGAPETTAPETTAPSEVAPPSAPSSAVPGTAGP